MCMHIYICTSKGGLHGRKMNSLKPVNLPIMTFCSVSEPLDCFKYAEVEVKIKFDVKNHHTKVLSR